jgi:outer membrane protein assembly factor BamA
MKTRLFSLGLLLLFSISLIAQDSDTISTKKEEKVKTGFSLAPFPVLGYDADIGFKYGALAYLYWYGDGSRYPMYNHSIYLEWSRTTKGNGINQITYETDRLIPGIRALFEVSYLTEKALDFYGFNGYQAVYDMEYEESYDSEGLTNRLFYRHSRELLRMKADFQGSIIGQKLRWLGGIAFYGISIDSVDVNGLNDKKDEGEELLSSNSLYGSYVDWGLIKDRAKGGNHTILKGGLVYDTRDNEPNPFSGIWTEMQLHYAPSFLSNTDFGYGRFIFTHRQYFTLIPEWMNFAYRLSYQGKIGGEIPYYMMPFMFQSTPKLTRDGLGGSKTIRGVRRNRVVGEGFAFGNVELRGKFLKLNILNQNFYFALAGFVDAGMITQKYDFDYSGMPDDLPDELPDAILDLEAKEVPHLGFGAGLHIAMNQNFIVTVDYGLAAKKEDGDSGLYINLNFLF